LFPRVSLIFPSDRGIENWFCHAASLASTAIESKNKIDYADLQTFFLFCPD
jgi:hypothetical protein